MPNVAEFVLQAKDKTEAPRARRVLFVCTGNTCRSPMAAALLNHMSSLYNADKPQIVAVSAGLYAHESAPISPHAAEVLEDAGVERAHYAAHCARTVTEDMISEADEVIGITGGHAMELMMRFPAAAKKITLMPIAIPDPFGGDLEVYQACLREITRGVTQLLFEGGAK